MSEFTLHVREGAGHRATRSFREGPGAASSQRGAVFYLMIVLLAMTSVGFLGAVIGLNDPARARAVEDDRLLQQARAAVLTYLSSPDLDGTGRRLGEWRLTPDLPVAAGAGNDSTEPNLDGFAESTGCAYRGWSAGQPLRPVALSGASARCFGRLPWRDLGVAIGDSDPTDVPGRVPWLVVSPNLMADAACLPNLNPLIARQAYVAYGCPALLPYPWLTVVDERGNQLSDRVAFALVLPGPPSGTQSRAQTSGPAAYLDRLTIAAGCPLPCTPGAYDNAAFDHADGQSTVLIAAQGNPLSRQRTGGYAQPDGFNDRVVFVTVDELLAVLERRARLEFSARLKSFRSAHGYWPPAAPLDAVAGDCAHGLRFGHPAVAPGSCGATEIASVPAWLTDAGWHRYFVYSVSPQCVHGSTSCAAPGLVVGSNSAVNAVLISPGYPITSAPYAASKNAAQSPLDGGLLSGLANDYLDSIENAAGTVDVFEPTTSQVAPNNDRLVVLE